MNDYLHLSDSFKRTEGINSTCIIKGSIANPLVTIAIPTYKRAELLRDTIDSVLNQKTDIEYEVLIVDNNPERNDETELLVKSYEDKRIRYFKNNQNLGLPGNWNRLYTLARGGWVVMVHDDDLLCVNYLEDIKKYMRDDVDILSGDFFPFYNNPVIDTSTIQSNAVIVPFERLWNGSNLVIAGLAIRKKAIERIGGFNSDFQNLDCVLITQMAYWGKAVKIRKPLAPYRILCNDSQNRKVFENCIIQEADRELFILKKSLPSWLANLIQVNSTLTLVNSWNRLFKTEFESPLYSNIGFTKRKISKIVWKMYSLYTKYRYPFKPI